MQPHLRLICRLSVAALLLAASVWGHAQPVPQPNLAAILGEMSAQPATHTGFVLDRSMLQVAQDALAQGRLDPQHAAAALSSVAFDSYRYRQPAFYVPEAFAALNSEYRAAGWQHLVDTGGSPAASAQPRATVTDLWLHFSGTEIDAVTVMTRAASAMNVVQLTGSLRPLDLLHLAGHFGIPRVDPSVVMVPEPPPAPVPPLNRR